MSAILYIGVAIILYLAGVYCVAGDSILLQGRRAGRRSGEEVGCEETDRENGLGGLRGNRPPTIHCKPQLPAGIETWLDNELDQALLRVCPPEDADDVAEAVREILRDGLERETTIALQASLDLLVTVAQARVYRERLQEIAGIGRVAG